MASDVEKLAHKQLLLSGTLQFTKMMFAYMNRTKYIVGEHHRLICDALDKVIRGETRKLIINIGPRYGKCVSPDTRILTGRGLIDAKDIKAGDILASFKDGKMKWRMCMAVGKAHKPSVKITMRSGREFVCSDDHPMLTPFGYKEAGRIVVGDRIQALCKKYQGNHVIDSNELDFITMMIFEGHCKKSYGFSNTDSAIIEIMRNCCKELGIEFKHRNSDRGCDFAVNNQPKVKEILSKYGIEGHLAYDKRVPKDWFMLTLEQRLRFIDLMFATDGYAQGNGQCGIGLANKGLVEDIQHMLASVGIISTFYYKPNKCRGAWVLCVSRRETIKLLGLISFFHKRPMAERAFNKSAVCITDTFPYEIISMEHLTYKALFPPYRCSGSKDITREKFLRLSEHYECLKKYICQDFYLDKVVGIESVGCKDLIDIEVDDTHNFIGNGLVSHNTELCSKMFIAYGLALNPEAKFLHLSYSGSLVQENSTATKDILKSEYFQAIFDTRVKKGADTKSKWSTEQGGGEYATSTLGQITGFGAGKVDKIEEDDEAIDYFTATFNPDRFAGAIVIDDPLKPDDALSDNIREQVNLRFETTIRNRVNSRKTPMVVIMQRLHEHDLCGYLQEIEPDEWTVLSIPAIQHDEQGNERALWPFKHTLDELHAIEHANDFVFQTQYMQNPTPREGLMYRPFRTYDALPPRNKAIRFNYTDSADTGADWLCSICCDIHPFGYYVTDVLYSKKPVEYTEQAMAQMLSKQETERCYVESNNGGRIFMRNVEKICREYENRKTQFIPFAQKQNKNVRIFTRANEVNNMIYMPSDWESRWPEFAHDLKSYRKEGRNAHDDAPDAITGVVEKAAGIFNTVSDAQLMNDFL